MQAQLSNIMYQILNDHVGEMVSCISLENGSIVEYRGILNQVLPFNGVMIDEDFVPFTSDTDVLHGGNAIREIIHLPHSKSLYLNPDTFGLANNERDDDVNYKLK